MRIATVLLAVFFCGTHTIQGEEMLILSGFYTGKNLYVQNPMLPDNQSFSTDQVYVNEHLVLSKPITSAFMIDLSHLDLDQSVEVRIVHKDRFPPRIVNAHVIRAAEVQETTSYASVKDVFRWTKADKKTIRWLTFGEKGGGTFELQRAKQELWSTVDVVPAKAINDESVYKVLIDHLPGDNTYRLKLTDRHGYVSYSPLIPYKLR